MGVITPIRVQIANKQPCTRHFFAPGTGRMKAISAVYTRATTSLAKDLAAPLARPIISIEKDHLRQLLEAIDNNDLSKIQRLLDWASWTRPDDLSASRVIHRPRRVMHRPQCFIDNCSKALLKAVVQDSPHIAEMLLKAGADVNARSVKLNTPLHLAANEGHADIAEMLLKAGADVNARGVSQYTPLHTAAWRGHPVIVEMLLKAGADVNARSVKLNTPLHIAANEGHADIAKMLLKAGADVNARDSVQNTPLYLAAYKGHADIAKMLLKAGADVNARGENQDTPLHIAAYEGHADIAKMLLKAGADVNARDEVQNTPLHLAAYKGFLDVVTILVRKKADLTIMDKEQRQALEIALKVRHTGVVRVLSKTSSDAIAEEVIKQYYALKHLGLHYGLSGVFEHHGCLASFSGYSTPCDFYQAFGRATRNITCLRRKESVELREAYQLVTHEQVWDSALMDRIRSGQLTIIERSYNTGTEAHSVALVFHSGLLIICNRAQSQVYAIDTTQLTAYNPNSRCLDKTLLDWVNHLPLTQEDDHVRQVLEPLMSSNWQKIGNCTSSSFKLSIRAALLLLTYARSKGSCTMQKTLERAYYSSKLETLTLRKKALKECLTAFKMDMKQVNTSKSPLCEIFSKCQKAINKKRRSLMHYSPQTTIKALALKPKHLRINGLQDTLLSGHLNHVFNQLSQYALNQFFRVIPSSTPDDPHFTADDFHFTKRLIKT